MKFCQSCKKCLPSKLKQRVRVCTRHPFHAIYYVCDSCKSGCPFCPPSNDSKEKGGGHEEHGSFLEDSRSHEIVEMDGDEDVDVDVDEDVDVDVPLDQQLEERYARSVLLPRGEKYRRGDFHLQGEVFGNRRRKPGLTVRILSQEKRFEEREEEMNQRKVEISKIGLQVQRQREETKLRRDEVHLFEVKSSLKPQRMKQLVLRTDTPEVQRFMKRVRRLWNRLEHGYPGTRPRLQIDVKKQSRSEDDLGLGVPERLVNVDFVHGTATCRQCHTKKRHMTKMAVTDEVQTMLWDWEALILVKEKKLIAELVKLSSPSMLDIQHVFDQHDLKSDFMLGAAKVTYCIDGELSTYRFVAVSGTNRLFQKEVLMLGQRRRKPYAVTNVSRLFPIPARRIPNIYGVELALSGPTGSERELDKPCAAIKLLIAIGRLSARLGVYKTEQIVGIELAERAHALFHPRPSYEERSEEPITKTWSSLYCVLSCDACAMRIPQMLCECSGLLAKPQPPPDLTHRGKQPRSGNIDHGESRWSKTSKRL
jgi:hypothetical protein